MRKRLRNNFDKKNTIFPSKISHFQIEASILVAYELNDAVFDKLNKFNNEQEIIPALKLTIHKNNDRFFLHQRSFIKWGW